MLLKERKDLLPPINSLLLPVCSPVIIEEAMAGFGVHVELVVLVVFFQLLFLLSHLRRCGRFVLLSKES